MRNRAALFTLLLGTQLLYPRLAAAQTLVVGECYSDDFLPTVGEDQVFDLTISLYAHPTTAERALYEEVVQHFARGVYEMSNRQQKIRNVVIHQDGFQKRFADIIWGQGGGEFPPTAVAHRGGILDDLGKLYVFDVSQDPNDPNLAFVDLVRGSADQRRLAGYIMTHEFGHYAYSLGDEYTRLGEPETQVVSIMSQVQRTVQVGSPDNLQWLNFSTDQSLNWSASGVASTQYGAWGTSSWGLLQQDCNVRRRSTTGGTTATGVLITEEGEREYVRHFPKSIYLSRLNQTTVVPAAANTWLNPNDNVTYPTMRADLTDAAADPLEHLNVTWMDSSNVEMELILDNSGSMAGTPLAAVISAANAFTGGVPLGRTTLGVTTFESLVNTELSPLQRILSASDVSAVQSRISSIVVGDDTAMFLGAERGLAKLEAYRATNGTNAARVAFLLSDGNDNASGGVTEQQVTDLYKAAGVRLHTVGYADRDASEAFFPPLQRLATATGGVFHRGLTAVADLQEAMRIALGDALSVQDITLSGLGEPLFPVDTLYSQLVFNVGYELGTGGSVAFGVVDARGVLAANSVFVKAEPDGRFLATIIVDAAAIQAGGLGTWQLVPTFTGGGGAVTSQRLFAYPGDHAPAELVVSSYRRDHVYPQPIEVYARTVMDGDLTGLAVTAELRAPSGLAQAVVMNDDGVGNDAAANDGLYSGQVGDYSENGVYTLSAISENTGSGVVIRAAGEPGQAGEPTDATFVPIGTNFSRRQEITLRVDGVVEDDHGDTPELATVILPDYSSHFGKIEISGDVDVFKVVGIDTTQSLNIRVYHANFGMVPEVTVYASDGVTPIAYGNPFVAATAGGYLSLAVPPAYAETELFFVVEHLNGEQGGTYTLDVGPTVVSDESAPSFLTVESRDVRLGEGNLSGIETRMENHGDFPLSDFTVVYYFDTEYFQTPVLEDWWSADSTPTLVQRGVEQYAVELDYTGFTLPAGGGLAFESENVLGLHYADWSPWDRTNDHSNNQSDVFVENTKIAVFDSSGRLIFGQPPLVRPARQPVVNVKAYSREDKLNDPAWTGPDIYIENAGDDISDFVVYYYFTAENGQAPVLADWHSPTANVSLQALGGSKYRVKYDYTGFTLPHLTSTPFPSRTLVGLHYANWSSVNRANDFSNNLSPNYLANTKIQVVDSAGNVIFGSAAP